MKNNLVPYYSLSPNSLTLYERPDVVKSEKKINSSINNLIDNTNYTLDLSSTARKRLNSSLKYMMYLTKTKKIKGKKIKNKYQNYITDYDKTNIYKKTVNYKITFITLTLPSEQIHSDKIIKAKLLNQFLIEIKTKHNVNNYIWKAEKQKNGNIHFHILIDNYIYWQTIRDIWNRIINKMGYVTKYQQNMLEYFKNGFIKSKSKKDKRTLKQQMKAYKNGVDTNWLHPNSTDIHALYSVKNLSAYMSKYMAKQITSTKDKTKLDILIKEIHDKQKEILTLENIINDNYNNKTITNKTKEQIKGIEIYISKLIILTKKYTFLGVEGRIWGQSSNLSKLKNYVDVCDQESIPDFDIVQNIATNMYTFDVLNTTIVVFYFDINKTTKLKKILNKHIFSILNSA